MNIFKKIKSILYKGFSQNFQTENINESVQNNIGRKATTEAAIESKLSTVLPFC